jgi:hypothetical protein
MSLIIDGYILLLRPTSNESAVALCQGLINNESKSGLCDQLR